VQFLEICTPTPRKVNGNSSGDRGFKSTIFLNESMTLNFWSGWGVHTKIPCVGEGGWYGY